MKEEEKAGVGRRTVVVTTDRLILRRQTVDDAEFIFALVNDPAWLRYIGDRGVHTVDDARAYIMNGAVKSYAENGFGLYLVETKADRTPIGVCGLVKRAGLDDVDIGFALMPAYRTSGYGFEAASATLVHARRDLGLKRIVAITSPDNMSSISLLKRLGLRFERLVRTSPDAAESALFGTVGTMIRAARPDEGTELAALAERTFRDTYTIDNTPANMDAHVARSFSPALQSKELSDPAMTTIVAEIDGKLAGYAQLRSAPAPAPANIAAGALEIWRFYVDRAHHGLGIAQELMIATIDAVARRGATAAWLGVWEKNWRARAFYAKCGFKDVGTQTFLLGADTQTDRVLMCEVARR